MNRGALYIATKSEHFKRGDYLKMALHSIDSLQKVSKLPITLVTNVPCDRDDINVVQVESVNTEKDYTKDKTFYMQHTPYESTIFIDADTEVLEDPEPLFGMDYDFRSPPAPKCDYKNGIWNGYWHMCCTATFLYNKNRVTDLFFERVKETYLQLEKNPNARIHRGTNMKDWESSPDRPWVPLNDQIAFNQAFREYSGRLGIIVKPLHPRWVGIDPIARFIDNVAIIHSRRLLASTEELTKWTVCDDTIIDDLSSWE